MNTGRISYNAEKRSVRKPMQANGRLQDGFSQFRNCAAVNITNTKEAQGNLAASCLSLTLWSQESIDLLFYRVSNELFALHADTAAVSASLTIPKEYEEKELANIIARLTELCKKENFVFLQSFVTVSDAVTAPILTLNASAAVPANAASLGFSYDASILAIGHCGISGAALLSRQKMDELKKHYAMSFLEKTDSYFEEFSIRKYASALQDLYLFPVGEGGILAALWYLLDGTGYGFDIDMKQIPIRQQTVEICEYYRVNPYQLAADGMLLAITDKPQEIMQALEREGIDAAVLGTFTKEKGGRIHNEEEVRFLDRPAMDELERLREL